MSPSPRVRPRLFWKIYLHGLLLVLALAVALSAVTVLSPDATRGHPQLERVIRVLRAEAGRAAADPADLQGRLAELADLLDLDLAVAAADGSIAAWAGNAPPAALGPSDLARLAESPDGMWRGTKRLMLPLEPGGPHLLVRFRGSHVSPRLAAWGAAILAVIALASYPLARAIVRPLERLTATSRALAGGDLSARTGIRRRDEVGDLAEALDEMAERLRHRTRVEREMLANVSHELRTPLARIRVALELCEEEETAECVKEHLGGIQGDVAELDRLVEDVLAAVRLDLAAAEGGLVLRREPVAVADLVERAAERFARHHPSRVLDVSLAAGLPELTADPMLLRRVLDNLLDNAAQHSPPDTAVELRARGEPGALFLEVRDRGTGVADEDLPRLFEPFFRAERSRSRRAGGVGLGLTLCKRIVEAHQGEIAVSHNPPAGLVVRVALPVRGPDEGGVPT